MAVEALKCKECGSSYELGAAFFCEALGPAADAFLPLP